MQQVDPFIKVPKKHTPPAGPYGSQYLKKNVTNVKTSANQLPQPNKKNDKSAHAGHHATLISDVVRTKPIAPLLQHKEPKKPKPIQDIVSPSLTPKAPEHHKAPTRPTKKDTMHMSTVSKIKVPEALQMFFIFIAAIGTGLAIQVLLLGEIIIGLYAVYAIVMHVPSRITFIMALITLIGVVILQIIQGSNSNLGNNFAVYTFLLLVVGTISLGFEVRKQA